MGTLFTIALVFAAVVLAFHLGARYLLLKSVPEWLPDRVRKVLDRLTGRE